MHRGQNLQGLREGRGKILSQWVFKLMMLIVKQFSPFSFGFCGKINTSKMKPLDGTLNKEQNKENHSDWQTGYNEKDIKHKDLHLGYHIQSSPHMTPDGTSSM